VFANTHGHGGIQARATCKPRVRIGGWCKAGLHRGLPGLQLKSGVGQPLSRRSRDWAIGELVADHLLEKGTPLPSGKGKPPVRYRVMAMFSGAQTTPAPNF
jgi:hypothetical protein